MYGISRIQGAAGAGAAAIVMYLESDGSEINAKKAILGALHLYLNVLSWTETRPDYVEGNPYIEIPTAQSVWPSPWNAPLEALRRLRMRVEAL